MKKGPTAKSEVESPFLTSLEVLSHPPWYLIITEEDEAIIQKDTSTPMFIAARFMIAKTRKQPKCPSTDEWIKKMR